MSSLSDLLATRQLYGNETNLERDKAFTIGPTGDVTCIRSDMLYCWPSPGRGKLKIEMWGAAGSGSRMCCCGFGLPGNAPAYVQKTICVDCGDYICGCPGQPCRAHELCDSGCSIPTVLCWCGKDRCGNTAGWMCSQGGKAGIAFCSNSASAYCCYASAGFCHTRLPNDNCAIVCNMCAGMHVPCGLGGDFGCCGCPSCVSFKGCQPNNVCGQQSHIAVAAHIYGTDGTHLTIPHEENNGFQNWSGGGQNQINYAQNVASTQPNIGSNYVQCYDSTRHCGCYETFGCIIYNSYGIGGRPPQPCPGVRDHGGRGGAGVIRLTYCGENTRGLNCSIVGTIGMGHES